jgi:hypothetical protein
MSTDQSLTRGARRPAVTVALLLTAAALMGSTSPVAAATPTPYGVNLVRNPGAEAGPASPDGNSTVNVPGWEQPIVSTVVAYGTAGFPTVGESNSYGGGDQFFYGGPDFGGSCDAFVQFIRVRGRNAAIDNGHVRARIKARIGTDSTDDRARVSVSFRDGNNHQLTTPNSGPAVLGPVQSTDGQMLLRERSRILPRKARILRVQLLTVSGGDDCAGYFDKISITLSYAP